MVSGREAGVADHTEYTEALNEQRSALQELSGSLDLAQAPLGDKQQLQAQQTKLEVSVWRAVLKRSFTHKTSFLVLHFYMLE